MPSAHVYVHTVIRKLGQILPCCHIHRGYMCGVQHGEAARLCKRGAVKSAFMCVLVCVSGVRVANEARLAVRGPMAWHAFRCTHANAKRRGGSRATPR